MARVSGTVSCAVLVITFALWACTMHSIIIEVVVYSQKLAQRIDGEEKLLGNGFRCMVVQMQWFNSIQPICESADSHEYRHWNGWLCQTPPWVLYEI
ncbi:hypothetical protein EDB19DRAFT_216692 [Suillus lakei]|nr:hypothetical protein EDB19DRAFT_216692 [Suillus lakei]